jgi:HK97 family phage prohead protease
MNNPLEKIEGLIKNGRDFRQFANFQIRAAEENQELYVEGYAATFNDPTVLWEYDGVQYKEQIDDRAFEEADMSDVIFNYNHSGKVMARTRNKTLQLSTDSSGLYIRARLDGTKEGRNIYEEIQGGYLDRMSFQFTVSESAYDSENRMRTVRKVKKLYDVSAVDIPAYDTTSIYARSLSDLVRAEKEKLDNLNELRKKKIILLSQL